MTGGCSEGGGLGLDLQESLTWKLRVNTDPCEGRQQNIDCAGEDTIVVEVQVWGLRASHIIILCFAAKDALLRRGNYAHGTHFGNPNARFTMYGIAKDITQEVQL